MTERKQDPNLAAAVIVVLLTVTAAGVFTGGWIRLAAVAVLGFFALAAVAPSERS